jgi:hypothetical protein
LKSDHTQIGSKLSTYLQNLCLAGGMASAVALRKFLVSDVQVQEEARKTRSKTRNKTKVASLPLQLKDTTGSV